MFIELRTKRRAAQRHHRHRFPRATRPGLGGAPGRPGRREPHVQLVRRDGRDVSTLYGREEGGSGGRMSTR